VFKLFGQEGGRSRLREAMEGGHQGIGPDDPEHVEAAQSIE
jgi:hypothetical protein